MSKLNTEDMVKAGVNFGHKVSKLHPKMKPYISGVKNNVHVFDLEKTSKELERAQAYVAKITGEGKTLLFVGTKPQLKRLVQKSAEDCKMPYVSERWLGGTLTNFETIQKRVDHFKELQRKKQGGELEKYTKKERLQFDKEIQLLTVKFEGIRNMPKLPEAVFIAGIDKNLIAAQEAKKKGVKVVAIVDTNINPDIVDYPIPANDDAMSSVSYILEQIKDAILNTKK